MLSRDPQASIILLIWIWVAPVRMSQDTQVVTVISLLIRWVMQEFPACRLRLKRLPQEEDPSAELTISFYGWVRKVRVPIQVLPATDSEVRFV